MNINNSIIRAYLTQKQNNKKHLIIYYSQKYSKIKQNYDIHDKRLFTIINILKHWKQYCKKILKLNIYTNHKNLTYFIIIKIFN